jgi:hypothetical protein
MAGKFLDRKIQFFEHRRMNLFRLPALATGAPEELDRTSKQQQVGLPACGTIGRLAWKIRPPSLPRFCENRRRYQIAVPHQRA